MRSFLSLPILLGLAAANPVPAPVPQDIEFDLVYALPNPTYTIATDATAQTVTYDATSVLEAAAAQITATITGDDSAGLVKRTACAPQPAGATGAPTLTTDTPVAFTNNAQFASIASNASAPSGYSQMFTNLKASNKYASCPQSDGDLLLTALKCIWLYGIYHTEHVRCQRLCC